MIWGERLHCINKSKDKNSNRRCSITSPSKSHRQCRSSATPAALCFFLPGHAPALGGTSCSLAQGFVLQLPAPVAVCTARCSAHPLLTRHFFCSTGKLRLLLFWQASFASTYTFSPSFPLLCCQNTPFLNCFFSISFPCLSYKVILVWIPLAPKHRGKPLLHAQGSYVLLLDGVFPSHKIICVDCFHSTC